MKAYIVAFVLCCIVSTALAAEPPKVEQNKIVEWTFHATAESTDPFNQLQLDLEVTPPSGPPLLVPAFWAGGKEWRARYASSELGRHTYRTICSDKSDTGLHDITGAIDIIATTSPNPLRAHGPIQVAADKRHFEYADGTPFFWLGDTWWMGLCNRLHFPDEFKTLTKDRTDKGFTVVQIVAGLYPDMPPFDERGANEAGFPWEKDYTRIHPEYFDAADKRLMYMADAGIVPCIVGAWGYFAPLMGAEKLKQHWRYLIARYGALPVVWCIAGEANLPWYLAKGFPYDDREQVKVWTEVARYVKQIDPYHRPISIHPTGLGKLSGRGAIDDASLLDFDMLQTGHSPDISILEPTMKTFNWSYTQQPTMPVINSEVSYERLMDKFPADPQRATFWAEMLSGAAGHTYGANGVWQCNRKDQPHGKSPHGGTYGAIPWDEAMNLPGSTQLSLAKKLLEQYPWQKLEPHPEWAAFEEQAKFSPYAAGTPQGDRIIYSPVPGQLLLHGLKPDQSYVAFTFDPVTGARKNAEVKADPHGDSTLSPVPPPQHDWVLVISAPN